MDAAAGAIEEIRAISDAVERGRAAQAQITALQARIDEFLEVRRGAMSAMLEAGMEPVEIARQLDLSPERVRQLMATGRIARAVLGVVDKLVCTIGGKHEAEKPAPVLSAEAFAAYEHLAELGRSVDLECTYEVVPPPGLVDLNRPNLVVIGSPRILPFVAQVLPADPAYGWGSDDDGWFLLDKAGDRLLRSPADSGGMADYAYVGRLPRPDSGGTFLYLAGIHAPGTLGAARWLVDNLDTINRAARRKRWSALIEAQYDDRGEITTTRLLAPITRHEGRPR